VWHFKKGEAVSEIAGCPFACPYANGGSAEREREGGGGKREYKESIKRFTKLGFDSLSECSKKRGLL
jgi:hypothetical protein